MENKYKKVMSERTDEELIKIVTVQRDDYQPLAVEAADAEIRNRNIDTSGFEQIRKKATEERIKNEKINSNVPDSGIRIANLLIDSLAYMVLFYILVLLVGFIFQPTDERIISILSYILFFGAFIAYYAIMEIKLQKTIGKFVTKTKVVKMNGEKPNDKDILIRTFCRLIPFDRISYLFMNNGFHDYFSKTKVVKDRPTN
jgi:uncharacterized RDD family membrane protein YckC